jgi:ketosteroid isomerase-like protein
MPLCEGQMSKPLHRHWRSSFTTGHLIAFALLSLAVCPSVYAAPPPQEQTILDLHTQWAKARIDGDVVFLERFYAPELTINAMNGSIVSRARDIAAFANRDIKPEVVEDEDIAVRIYDDTAVVTGIEHVRGTAYGRQGEFRLRFTNVLVRRRNGWQLVQHQSTPIDR